MVSSRCTPIFYLLIAACVVPHCIGGAQHATFEPTIEIEEAYGKVLDFRFAEAEVILAHLQKTSPQNLLTDFISDYVDFFVLFVSEDRDEFDRRKANRDKRLERLRTGDAQSPYYLYTQAEVHMHWAFIKIKFGEYFAAATAINKAFKLLKRNEKAFPDFAPNLKTLGMLRAGVGTIPDKYRWAVKLVSSLQGTVDEGMQDLQRAHRLMRKAGHWQQRELTYMYATAMVYFQGDAEGAWDFTGQAALDPTRSPLDCYLLSNLAIKTGQNEVAIDLLENRPKSASHYPFYFLDLLLGTCKLYRLDSDADIHLLRYAQDFKGFNYIKESYQKLAWHALLREDNDGYARYMAKCLHRGSAVTDEDQYALTEAERGQEPNRALLTGRLLFDGGYHSQAIRHFTEIATDGLSAEERMEHTYRLARALHENGNHTEALMKYGETIEAGAHSRLYYACSAALHAGMLHEQMGNLDKAGDAFKQCLSIRPGDYQSSLHQKAKSGLRRL